MLTLYDYLPSGNSYKVRWLLSYLGRSYRHIGVDIHKGETQSPEFLDKNPAGQIPLLITEDGRALAESNAIMIYLGEGSDLIPADKFDRAKMFQWMFFEQYKHEPAIAVARFIRHYAMDTREAELPNLMTRGNVALGIMETHLSGQDWFACSARSLADIALYAYTHVANEGGFNLREYPAVSDWLARFADHPAHILIADEPA